MSILGISAACIGTPTKNTIRFKGRKNHTSIFKSNIIIIQNIREGRDNNLNNFNSDKNYKKIKISKLNKYYGE